MAIVNPFAGGETGWDIREKEALAGAISQVRREGIVIRSIVELDACCWGQLLHCRETRHGCSRVTKHQLKARCDGQRATYKDTHPPAG